jgi:hypothetical protein
VKPKPQSECVCGFAHGDLRRSVFRPDLRHRPRTRRRIALLRPSGTRCCRFRNLQVRPFWTCSKRCSAMDCHCLSGYPPA